MILGLISKTLLVIGALEIISRRSQKNGALIFERQGSGFPRGQWFLCLHLPTIIVVIYNTIWSWVDLDTKRMEPFFQLSMEGGARGEDSILLHCPFDFLPYASFVALKRR